MPNFRFSQSESNPCQQGKNDTGSEIHDLMLLILLRRKCCIAEVVFQLLQSSLE